MGVAEPYRTLPVDSIRASSMAARSPPSSSPDHQQAFAWWWRLADPAVGVVAGRPHRASDAGSQHSHRVDGGRVRLQDDVPPWPAVPTWRQAGDPLCERASRSTVRETSRIWSSALARSSRNGVRPPTRWPASSVRPLRAHDAPKVPTVRRESPLAPNAMVPLAPSNSAVARAREP